MPDLLTLEQAAHKFLGKTPHKNTLRRWASEGVKVPGGGVVKLRVVRCGRTLFVPENAWSEFIAAQNPQHQGEIATPDHEHAAAEARLDEMGV